MVIQAFEYFILKPKLNKSVCSIALPALSNLWQTLLIARRGWLQAFELLISKSKPNHSKEPNGSLELWPCYASEVNSKKICTTKIANQFLKNSDQE